MHLGFRPMNKSLVDGLKPIPPLDMPKFEGHLREEDLEGLEGRDRKMMLAISRIEQKQDWNIKQVVTMHAALVNLQDEVLAQRNEALAFKLRVEIFKWITVTLGAGLVAGLSRKLIDKILP